VEDYRTVNAALWDERAPVHATAADYRVQELVDDPAALSHVVAFDLPRLPEVRGRDVVHLQCHIGTDTLSLARLGARVTGLDLSGASLEQARSLAARTGTEATYVQGELYDAVDLLGASSYDVVFTGVGALCWLPDIARWGRVVADLLRPGGVLHLRESHPVLWSLADRDDGELVIDHPYFETAEPVVWDEQGSYVDADAVFARTRSLEWNHGLGEVVTALLAAGLVLTRLQEHDSVPWEALGGGAMEEVAPNEWRLRDRPERLAHSYTLQAAKPA